MAVRRCLLLLCGAAILLSGCSRDPTVAELEEARERMRPVVPQVVRTDFIETCLRDHAVTAFTRLPDGGFEGFNVSDTDFEVLRGCMEAAEEEYPLRPPPSTRAEFQVMYELLLLEAACLEQEGYAIEIPTLDAYIDRDGMWTPYENVPHGPDWVATNERCPQELWHYDRQPGGSQ